MRAVTHCRGEIPSVTCAGRPRLSINHRGRRLLAGQHRETKQRREEMQAGSVALAGAVAPGTGVMIGAGVFALAGPIAGPTGRLSVALYPGCFRHCHRRVQPCRRVIFGFLLRCPTPFAGHVSDPRMDICPSGAQGGAGAERDHSCSLRRICPPRACVLPAARVRIARAAAAATRGRN